MKYAWIEAHRETYSTPMMCELLSVSRSGLYQARRREPSARGRRRTGRRADSARAAQAPRSLRSPAHDAGGQRRRSGAPINHKRIGRLMREHDLAQPQAPPVSGGDDGFEACSPDGAQRAGARLPGDGAESEVAG